MGTIFRRELKGYFDSPMGFGIIGAFVVVIMLLSVLLDPAGSGGNWFERGELSMRTFFGIFPWVAAVVVPAVSMRLWSEDRRQATFELLMTLPIPTWRIALGKYFAGLVFLVCMLLATAAFPLMLMYFGSPDWGPVFGGYIACFLLGAAFVAVGLFVSGLTENQALSFFLAMLICLGIVGVGEMRGMLSEMARENPQAAMIHLLSIPLVGLGILAAVVGRDKLLALIVVVVGFLMNTGVYLFTGGQDKAEDSIRVASTGGEAMVQALAQVAVLEHFREIQRGVVNTNGLVFFVSLIVLFVFLNVWSLESRRYS
ncbi:MAG: ABC-2 transporter permease [Planctomycetes bacterium]|nr:ABC-2 transporter permease [Planctomycetota bacterium]